MIPYEELVAALARWRARRGLPTGLGDTLGEPAPTPSAGYASVRDHSLDDVVEVGEDMLDGLDDDTRGRAQPYQAYARDRSAGRGEPGRGEIEVESFDPVEMSDFDAPVVEQTRPAGLAGLVSSNRFDAEETLDAEEPQPPSAAPGQGRGRVATGRRRRK